MKKLSSYLSLILMLFLLLPNASSAQANQQERIKGWSADIDTMLLLMKSQHYIYRSKPLPQQLLDNAASLKTKVAQYSDERMLNELERLMFYMHDGHSYILPVATKVQAFFLPVQFYIFSDGVYIVDADDPYKNLIGSKVLTIQNVAVAKLVNDMNYFIHQDNRYTVLWFAPSVLRFRGLYEAYGLAAGSPSVQMNLVSQNKKTITQNISFIPATNFHGIPKLIPSQVAGKAPPPLYLSSVANNFWFTSLPQKKALYFQFNQVQDKDNESLALFSTKLDSALQRTKPTLFIIDVRHNNGGNLELLPPLVDVIKKFENINPGSKIVVITGRNTFSAAQVFISLLNKDTHALFAGEPSSSSPNFVGEGNYISLPYSGAMGSISNKYHETIPGDKRKWIEPVYPVSLSSTAYFKNQDPVMEFILKIK